MTSEFIEHCKIDKGWIQGKSGEILIEIFGGWNYKISVAIDNRTDYGTGNIRDLITLCSHETRNALSNQKRGGIRIILDFLTACETKITDAGLVYTRNCVNTLWFWFLSTRYSGECFLSHHGWTWLIKCILFVIVAVKWHKCTLNALQISVVTVGRWLLFKIKGYLYWSCETACKWFLYRISFLSGTNGPEQVDPRRRLSLRRLKLEDQERINLISKKINFHNYVKNFVRSCFKC